MHAQPQEAVVKQLRKLVHESPPRSPENEDFLFLGQMAIQGERGLLKIPTERMLRLRYNPFYDFLESRTIEWVDHANKMD